jgi:HSP20 family protein
VTPAFALDNFNVVNGLGQNRYAGGIGDRLSCHSLAFLIAVMPKILSALLRDHVIHVRASLIRVNAQPNRSKYSSFHASEGNSEARISENMMKEDTMAKDIKKAELAQTPAPMDPFSAMRSEMDRAFENFLGRGWPSMPGLMKPSDEVLVVPSMDIRENGSEIVIEAELPGMEEKDIDVSLSNGMLTIRGEKRSEEEKKEDNYHLTERRYGSFQRSFRVPDTVDPDKVEASLEKGVLHVTMTKKPEAVSAAKKISVTQK